MQFYTFDNQTLLIGERKNNCSLVIRVGKVLAEKGSDATSNSFSLYFPHTQGIYSTTKSGKQLELLFQLILLLLPWFDLPLLNTSEGPSFDL